MRLLPLPFKSSETIDRILDARVLIDSFTCDVHRQSGGVPAASFKASMYTSHIIVIWTRFYDLIKRLILGHVRWGRYRLFRLMGYISFWLLTMGLCVLGWFWNFVGHFKVTVDWESVLPKITKSDITSKSKSSVYPRIFPHSVKLWEHIFTTVFILHSHIPFFSNFKATLKPVSPF